MDNGFESHQHHLIWNSLPEHVIMAATLQSFKKHLKTF